MKTTSKVPFLVRCLVVLWAVLSASLHASEAGRRIAFRTLGWNTDYEALYLPGATQDQPYAVPLRSISPPYLYRGGSVLEFYTAPPPAKDSEGPPPPPLVSVRIPDHIEQALLLFTKSGGTDKSVEVKVIDDSLKVFPLMTARAINFCRKPIEVTLLNASKQLAPGSSSLWRIPSPPPARSRIILAAPSGPRWQPFLTQTLDLISGHRIYLFLHEATAVTAIAAGEGGDEAPLLLKPEERPAHWFAIWDRPDPMPVQTRR